MADTRISLPMGKLVYPRLKTPDTKFDELGQYKADVAVPKEDAQEAIDVLVAAWKKHVGKAPKLSDNPMFYDETDADGNETGNVVFKCRVKNRMRKDGQLWDRRPKLFDAKLKSIDVNPFGGSTAIVSADIYEWVAGAKKGCSLQPVGVQVLTLVEGTGVTGESMGFKAQEGYSGIADEDEDGYADDTDYIDEAFTNDGIDEYVTGADY